MTKHMSTFKAAVTAVFAVVALAVAGQDPAVAKLLEIYGEGSKLTPQQKLPMLRLLVKKHADSKELAALLAKVASRHWFDGTYRPLNEVSIVDETGAIHRPDRVLVERDKPLGQGCALVIDYKFGHRQERYARQIRRYMDLIQRMGYREVRGTLWYCNEEAEDIH